MVMNPKVGLRQYFEANGKQVNYDNNTGNIRVLDPQSQQFRDIGAYSRDAAGNAQIDQNTAQGLFAQPTQKYDYQSALKNYMDTATANDFSNAQKLANSTAARQAGEKRQGYQAQLNLLSTNRDNALHGVDTGIANDKQNLEDNSFQKYLASRQSLANSGLSGTGLAEDQNTRLELANKRNMSQLLNNAEQQRYALNNTYNTQSQSVQDAMNNINESQLAQELYNQYRAQQLQENAQKAQALYNGMNFQAQQDQRATDNQYRDNQASMNNYRDARDFQNNNDWKQKTFDNQNDQWNKTYDFNKSNSDWTHNFQDKQFNAEQAYKQQQLAEAAASRAASAERASASASSATSNANVNRLMDIWKMTGQAPDGIPGVTVGTKLYNASAAKNNGLSDKESKDNYYNAVRSIPENATKDQAFNYAQAVKDHLSNEDYANMLKWIQNNDNFE